MSKLSKLLLEKQEGKIIYNDGILYGVVALSIAELDYVELAYPVLPNNTTKAVVIDNYSKDGAKVDVYVKIHYSQSITEIAFKIQEAVRHNLEAFTENKVATVNVNVVGVLFDKDNEDDKIEKTKAKHKTDIKVNKKKKVKNDDIENQ